MSSIEVRCPGCASSYRVSSDAVRKKGHCKRCGQSFIIQSAADTCDWAGSETDASDTAAGRNGTALPDNVGRFEIKQKLGKGGFGTVYRAYDPNLEREVALKVPHSHLLNSVSDRQRYLREAKAAARLRHAHIVPLFEAKIDGDTQYIASAFIEGQSLDMVLRERRPGIAESVGWVVKLARAIEYAHGQGIIHRDIKPGNIMLDVHGEPLLMDFGLARMVASDEQLTQADSVLGTPAYMSPEQAAGRIHEISPATDQYSLGVLLYELISGKRPFTGSVGVVISMVINASAPPPSEHNAGISGELESICLKMMSKQIGDRYRSLNDVAVDLERYLEHSRDSVVASKDIGALVNLIDIPSNDFLPQVFVNLSKPNIGSKTPSKKLPYFRFWTYGANRQVQRLKQVFGGMGRGTLAATAIIAAGLVTVLAPLSLGVFLHSRQPATMTESPSFRTNNEGISVDPQHGPPRDVLGALNLSSVSLRPIAPNDVVTPDESKGLQDFFEFSHPTDLPSLECFYVEMAIRQGRQYSLAFSDNQPFPVLYTRFATEEAFFVPDDRPNARAQELIISDPGINKIRFIATGDSEKTKCFFKFYYDEKAIGFPLDKRELVLAEDP